MNIAFDTTPNLTQSKNRGIGTYTLNLLKYLKKINEVKIYEFNSDKIPDADLVHYPYFDLFFHTLPIKKNIPRVVTIHDVIPIMFPEHFPLGIKGNLNLYLQKLALKKTDAIICDSNASRDDVSKKFGYPLGNIHVVYLAPSEDFKPSSDKEKIRVKEKYEIPDNFYLYVGDVNWNKNVLGLLDSIKQEDIQLIMVGQALVEKSLKQAQEINKRINSLHLENRVKRLGYLPPDDLAAIYSLAKATIVPSFYEGFGLPVLESMSCGTPVLCSENSSLTEVGGDAAIFFNPNNVNSISTAIKKFNSLNQTQYHNIKEKSLKQANNFTWKKTARETINVYQAVLGEFIN